MDSPILRGWKSIAAYLDCSVATAKRLEPLGLPLTRFNGGVMASSNALEVWIIENSTTNKQ